MKFITVTQSFKGPWTPKLTYTFDPFSWKCRTVKAC